MFPASFEYHSAGSIQEAIDLLEAHGDDARLLAGGHSLIPLMKMRLAQPGHLVDISRISELQGVRLDGDSILIGAFTTHRQVETSEILKQKQPLLAELASVIADPQVRNRGTIGGSVCHADPGADFPAAVMALDAELICQSKTGVRVVKAADWFQGIMTSAIEQGEVLTAVRFPVQREGAGAAYLKLPHPSSRFAIMGVAAVVERGPGNMCRSARIGITGLGTRAVRAGDVETAIVGRELTSANIEEAARLAANGADTQDDIGTTLEQKVRLCRVMTGRAIGAALKRATAS